MPQSPQRKKIFDALKLVIADGNSIQHAGREVGLSWWVVSAAFKAEGGMTLLRDIGDMRTKEQVGIQD